MDRNRFVSGVLVFAPAVVVRRSDVSFRVRAADLHHQLGPACKQRGESARTVRQAYVPRTRRRYGGSERARLRAGFGRITRAHRTRKIVKARLQLLGAKKKHFSRVENVCVCALCGLICGGGSLVSPLAERRGVRQVPRQERRLRYKGGEDSGESATLP